MGEEDQCKSEYSHLGIIRNLSISEEAAHELAGELRDGELGLIQDLTYDGYYYIVRWHDDE